MYSVTVDDDRSTLHRVPVAKYCVACGVTCALQAAVQGCARVPLRISGGPVGASSKLRSSVFIGDVKYPFLLASDHRSLMVSSTSDLCEASAFEIENIENDNNESGAIKPGHSNITKISTVKLVSTSIQSLVKTNKKAVLSQR